MTYIFESGLAHHIEGLIQQKRADGYAYNSEEKLLKRFDTFCVQNYPELTTVTYEMAAKWSEARPGEGDAYHNRRMDLADAVHREERDKKKSVVDQLKGQPKTEHKKTAPKKSAEREI